MSEVLVAARVGKYFNPSVISNDHVFHEKCVVFGVSDVYSQAALFNSSPVQAWVWKQSSRLKLDLNFSPTDAIRTFPFPTGEALAGFEKLGRDYLHARREIMTDSANPVGLTKLYNRFHDAREVDPRIARLREMHREIDAAIMRAYGWDDLDPGHGYHEQSHLAENDRVRFTISESARTEVLRRFAELNRQRHDQELSAATPVKSRESKGRAEMVSATQGAFVFIEAPEDEPKPSRTNAAPAKMTNTRRTRK